MTETCFKPGWWAGALSLAERCALPGEPDLTVPAERAERRLSQWRETYWFTGLDERLARSGLDEARLREILAEDPAGLATRAGRPGWARQVEAAVAGIPADPALPEQPVDDEAAAWAGLAAIVAPFTGLVPTCVRAHLERKLVTIACRTLILELHVMREAGRLTGDTPRRRFWSFVRELTRPDGFVTLLSEYPVLARLLAEAAERAAAGWAQVSRRLGDDQRRTLVEMSGDRVMVLRFADGSRLVHRRAPLGPHEGFARVLDWLNQRLPGLDLRTPAVLERDGYGWVEFVEQRPCADLERLHYRSGALLALLYALDAAGFSSNDVVACADQPVLVELGGLFHPRPPTPDPATAAWQSSVRWAGALAVPSGAKDLPVVRWEAPGTDRMRVARPGTAPQERQKGAADAVVAGFLAAYDAVVAGRDELVGLLERFAGAEMPPRADVHRAESTHPDVLRDALDRERVLGHPSAIPARERLEPYRAVEKVRAMGPCDRAAQEWAIRAWIAETSPAVPTPADIDPQRCLQVACRIADELAESAYQQGDRAGWIGLVTDEEVRWWVRPLGSDLYDGSPGVALFLAKLAELTGQERYGTLARQAVAHVPELLERLDLGSPRCGAFHGMPGLGYAMAHVAASLDDATLLEGVVPPVAAAAMSTMGDAPDLAGGVAGCLAAMLAIDSPPAHRVAQIAARRLIEWTDSPQDSARIRARTGFARGSTGIAWALLRHAAATDQPRSAQAGHAVLGGEPPQGPGWCDGAAGVALALAQVAGPAVDAVVSSGPAADHSLCHGELGCLEALTDPDLRVRRATRLLDDLERNGPRCGTPGTVATPGLMTGLSGIGYGLLRLAFPDRVPSVLLLEPPVGGERR